jgi:hypothetical protein
MARCAISTTTGSFGSLGPGSLRGRVSRRFRRSATHCSKSWRDSISTRRSARWLAAFEDRAAAALRQQQFERDQRRSDNGFRRGSPSRNTFCSAIHARHLPRTARAKTTVPTGLRSLPPSGPATAADRNRDIGPAMLDRALRHGPGTWRSKPRRKESMMSWKRPALSAWLRSNRSRNRDRAPRMSRESRSSRPQTSPPVQLSASATVRPSARFSAITRWARVIRSSESKLTDMVSPKANRAVRIGPVRW